MLEKKREIAQANQLVEQSKMPPPNAFEIEQEENDNDSIDSSKLPNTDRKIRHEHRETSMSDTSQNEEERKEQAQYQILKQSLKALQERANNTFN